MHLVSYTHAHTRTHTHAGREHTFIHACTGARVCEPGGGETTTLASALACPPICVICNKLIDRPIFVAAIGKEAPNGEWDLSLSELLLGDFERIRFVCHLHHDGRVHAVHAVIERHGIRRRRHVDTRITHSAQKRILTMNLHGPFRHFGGRHPGRERVARSLSNPFWMMKTRRKRI